MRPLSENCLTHQARPLYFPENRPVDKPPVNLYLVRFIQERNLPFKYCIHGELLTRLPVLMINRNPDFVAIFLYRVFVYGVDVLSDRIEVLDTVERKVMNVDILIKIAHHGCLYVFLREKPCQFIAGQSFVADTV